MLTWIGRIATTALLIAAGAWLVLLRPIALGGTTSYVFVGGSSMLPTYAVGDLLVTQPAATYPTHAVIVYRIPAGTPGAGRLVVHRIVGGDAATGFDTQGDHNGYLDTWHPTAADIVGAPIAVLPGAGLVIGFLRQPVVAASFATLLAVSVLWPTPAPLTGVPGSPVSPQVPPADGRLRQGRRRPSTRTVLALAGLAILAALSGIMAGRAAALGRPNAAPVGTESMAATVASSRPDRTSAPSPLLAGRPAGGSVGASPAVTPEPSAAPGLTPPAVVPAIPATATTISSAPATPAPAAAPAGAAAPAVMDRYALLRQCPGIPGCWLYVVRAGDNLWSIARWFGVPFEAVIARNPQVTDPSLLVAGQQLSLPAPTR